MSEAALSWIVPGATSVGGSPLLSTTNLYEHELIFLSPYALARELWATQQHYVQKDKHEAAVAKMAQLVEWVKKGHTLVALGPTPVPFSVVQYGRTLHEFSVECYSPLDLIKMTPKSGGSVQVSGQNEKIISDLLSKHLTSYSVVISGKGLVPLITVKTANTSGATDIVAGYVQLEKGLVIFAPHWNGPGSDYWQALAQLPSILRREPTAFPEWVDDYRTKSEAEIFDSRERSNQEVQKLRAEIIALEADIENQRQLKRLFTATGPDFEDAVCDALRELGFQMTVGPHPRADLLGSDGVRVAAIEAKGIEGAAREEHVRQVMMWMPEVDAALSTPIDESASDPVIESYKTRLRELDLSKRDTARDCKGILVLGTFRSLPLAERTGLDFVNNVAQVLTRQDVCALTGLQLFNLVIIGRTEPEKKQGIRAAIMATIGVLGTSKDWSETMQVAPKSGE
jgi:hypothetical protein